MARRSVPSGTGLRRPPLLAEPVALVFAVREPNKDFEFVGLPELTLGGLADEDARSLLATVIPGRLDERVRVRIVAERAAIHWRSWGSPGALGEKAGRWVRRPGALAVVGPDRGELPAAPGRAARLRRGMLLLVAAAEPVGEPAPIRRAAATRLGIPGTAIEPAARGRPAGRRCTGALSAPAGAVDRLSIGFGSRAAERTPSTGIRHRC